ncbi:D-isomer specific 2-hydroxyacid dehydrogenase family protein [Anaerostipes butyraticus]|mgnify:FL=1|uniref:D-isomer specific 2-hydroxyacid dehydrogenase family protein n=1 Tax=Anaerostipes butyraticus TaxID=645466 RepID=UPI003207DEA9
MAMKIAVFNCRPDERGLFEFYKQKYNIELAVTSETPTLENCSFVKGCQAVSIITTPVNRDLLQAWKEEGIQAVSTRTVGYDHIDLEAAEELEIPVSNVSYTPHTVAEYTVMAILMTIRRMKTILTRYQVQDYSLTDVRGKELRNMTVGVVGTGKIGEQVIHNLSGFGCRILAHDPFPKDSLQGTVHYTNLEELWRECDILTFHTPASRETCHMVNHDTLRKMKKGVILINMARGSLIDTAALIEALDQGIVSAAALDVLEHESGIYYQDYKYAAVNHHDMAVLKAMPNVLMTPHTAFFTDEAVADMIRCSIESCMAEVQGETDPGRIG